MLSNSSGQREDGNDLEQLLRSLKGESPEVVRGVLSSLFGQLPEALQKKKLEEVLYKEDLCFVEALAETSRAQLREIGLSVGAAALVHKVLFPAGAVGEVVAATAVNATLPRPVLRAFPMLEQTGWPTIMTQS